MKRKYLDHTHSYLSLRKAVGWIGILLPFVLMFGLKVLFGEDLIQPSMSHYYFTGMRDVFVGSLCAVALFLFFYSGYDWRDDWTGNLAGVFALGVAFFPTTEYGPAEGIGVWHFIFASLLFICLAFFSLFLFTKHGGSPSREKRIRNRIYIICGIVMLAILLAMFVYLRWIQSGSSPGSFVFWGEAMALIAFGVSWLTKGGSLYSDKPVS